MKPNNI